MPGSTYTTNIGLNKPSNADQNWDTPVRSDLDSIDSQAAIGGLGVRASDLHATTFLSTSLNVNIAPGTYRKADGTVGTYAGATSQAMTANQTNYLYLTDAGVLTVNTTGFPASTNIVTLATVVAGASTITLPITDSRRPFQSFGATSLDLSATRSANTVLAGPTSGGAAAPTFRAMVAADIPGTLNSTVVIATSAATVGLKVEAFASQTASLLSFIASDGTTLLGAFDKLGRHVSAGSAPGIAAGSGAGTSPTVSIAGNDVAGVITVTTGGSPGASATIATITFANAFGAAPQAVILTPANVNAAGLSGASDVWADSAAISTSVFTINSGSSGLTASTTYKWFYRVQG